MSNAEFVPLYPLGHVALTPQVKRMLSDKELVNVLLRHIQSGESPFGTLRTIDALPGCRVLSVYRIPSGQTILVITDADRARTTLLLAEEYWAV